jgi:hypothetical protein
MADDDKPDDEPVSGRDEMDDFERRVRKLVRKRAKKDADFAFLKHHIDERLPKPPDDAEHSEP